MWQDRGNHSDISRQRAGNWSILQLLIHCARLHDLFFVTKPVSLANVCKVFFLCNIDKIYLTMNNILSTKNKIHYAHFRIPSKTIYLCVHSTYKDFLVHFQTAIWRPLPYVVFGLCGTVSGALCLLLPETLNRKLCDTIAEEEKQEYVVTPIMFMLRACISCLRNTILFVC